MTRAARVAVGLGSNLGDRLGNLRRARARLAALAPIAAASSVWETEPVTMPGADPQPSYLNAVVVLEWPGTLQALLAALLEIERGLGRVRRERWGPRTIDLDVLLAEDAVVSSEGLTVPHPRLAERAFALAPLLEAWPDARHPTTGARYAELDVDRTGVARAGPL